MNDEDRRARVALAHLVEPGSWRLHRAVEAYGAVEVAAALQQGRVLPGLLPEGVEGAHQRATTLSVDRALDQLHAAGGRVVVPGDDDWPEHRLTWATSPGLAAPPLAVFLRGARTLAEVADRAVAVVGARAATAYGQLVARELAAALADAGHPVISGAAYGIDGEAHRGALASGRAFTAAVLACGLDVAYPRGHDRLIGSIADSGLLLGEHLPGASPTRSRFLVRNRLIAALSVGTVVVEADLRSGSLATARRAAQLGRHVMAVPGPVTSRASRGCHQLVREEGAQLVEDVDQVLALVGPVNGNDATGRRGPERPRDHLSDAVRRVLDAVPFGRGADVGAGEAAIARDAGVPVRLVQEALPPLLVHGLVERCEVGWRLTALGAERPSARPIDADGTKAHRAAG